MRAWFVVLAIVSLSGCDEKRCADAAPIATAGASCPPAQPSTPPLRVDSRCVLREDSLDVLTVLTIRTTFDPGSGPPDANDRASLIAPKRMVYSAHCLLRAGRCQISDLTLGAVERGEPLTHEDIGAEEEKPIRKLSESRYQIVSRMGMNTEIDLAAGTVRTAYDMTDSHYRAEGTCITHPAQAK
jgi:hypothetical protein